MYAHNTAWAAWRDSDMRSWLVYHRYLRSDAQKTRGELVKLMQDKYTNVASRTAKYLTWPNARLRPYLRENGISDDTLPTTRPRLLQELRIRWTQAKWRAGTLWRPVKDIIRETGGRNGAQYSLHSVCSAIATYPLGCTI